MAISDADWELMEEVAAYFESTRKEPDPTAKYQPKREDTRSVNETAAHFGITRSKTMKMLITMGVISTSISEKAQRMRAQGMSIKEIAETLGVSTGTVSSNLPYEDEIHKGAEVSDHAAAMREYRAYEKMQKERQVGKNTSDSEKERQNMKEKNYQDDWRKELDISMSFKETDTRRKRLTREMMEEVLLEQKEALKKQLEDSGAEIPDLSDFDYKKLCEELRAKESLTPEEVVELGEFPGALDDRNGLDLEEIYGEELPYEPDEVIRLHLELVTEFTDVEKEIMRKYGAMEGETVSRDIVVPYDLPLYALHFVIQRAFGWQNSHLHRFFVPDEVREKLTPTVDDWMKQVGVIYRSPLMDEEAEFWADDYERGSFKNWLRNKYTGPYISQCWGEGILPCLDDLEEVDLNEEFYVVFGCIRKNDEEAMPLMCIPVLNWEGKKNEAPKENPRIPNFRMEVMKLRDLPVELLNHVFDRSPFDILERLPLNQVLAARSMHCKDEFQEWDSISTFQDTIDDGLEEEIGEILDSGLDSPSRQPYVYSFTDELVYWYDYGDGWEIRITGSHNCADLVESGKITQDMLDKSNIKTRVTYRPVLLYRDGEMMIDDVGGPHGFVRFIYDLNTLKRGETDDNDFTKTELKEWARSQGWHRDNSSDFSLL
ncbi:MAG: hypothetical protein IJ719_02115 [Clostridia bacterium]|nr:hypothetical protein [Clostridia bacterium]